MTPDESELMCIAGALKELLLTVVSPGAIYISVMRRSLEIKTKNRCFRLWLNSDCVTHDALGAGLGTAILYADPEFDAKLVSLIVSLLG